MGAAAAAICPGERRRAALSPRARAIRLYSCSLRPHVRSSGR
eukprot:COSAG03_NODE_22821_length_286_cov_1.106952_1_plen_41_part_10